MGFAHIPFVLFAAVVVVFAVTGGVTHTRNYLIAYRDLDAYLLCYDNFTFVVAFFFAALNYRLTTTFNNNIAKRCAGFKFYRNADVCVVISDLYTVVLCAVAVMIFFVVGFILCIFIHYILISFCFVIYISLSVQKGSTILYSRR